MLAFKNKSKKSGFTLIELLVVIAVIGVLASVVMVSLRTAQTKSRDAQRVQDMKQLQIALELFSNQTSYYPVTADAGTWSGRWDNLTTCLETGVGCGVPMPADYEPVMKQVPQDPRRSVSTPGFADMTYFYAAPSACGTGKAYRLGMNLETDHIVLATDLDGSYFNDNLGCEDSTRGYCLGVESCLGW